MAIAEILRQLRKDRGWTQQELARRSGVVQGIITNIEKGRTPNPTAQTVQRLAEALGVSTDVLLGLGSAEDIDTPPVDLLRAAGYTEALIADLVESWHRQPARFRSDVIRRAKRRVQESQELYGALL